MIGSAVCCPEPLEITNEGTLELITVMFTAPVTCPWATLRVPLAEGELREKLSVVRVTARLKVARFILLVDVPVTVTGVLPVAIFGSVVIVSWELPLPPVTDAGLNAQVAPVGKFEHARLTVSLKLFWGVIVIVATVLLPAAILAGLSAPADTEKVGIVANHAVANSKAFTEPRPVTWSYPVPALNPISVVPDGQSTDPLEQGTLLSPVVTS